MGKIPYISIMIPRFPILAAAVIMFAACSSHDKRSYITETAGPDSPAASEIRMEKPSPETVSAFVDQNSPAALGTYRCAPELGWEKLEKLAAFSTTAEEWQQRREQIRKDMRHELRLDSFPEHFYGKVYLSEKRGHGSYSVQDLGLEILPGIYCTASLYTPEKMQKAGCPVVINPHGHDPKGRNADYVQTRCAIWAQLGCIAISYDMFAYGEDSFFDMAWHKSCFAQPLQVLSALRLIDFALDMKEADPSRVGITGCSGGGSICMFATAVDERITLSMPVVMMSSYFNGGCICESGTQLHSSADGTNNVEIAAICAPRPMLLVSDGADWTAHMPEVDFPFVKRIYALYGAEEKVENVHFPDGQHNYDAAKRQAAYSFLIRNWQLDASAITAEDGSISENGCAVGDAQTMRIWGPGKFPLPEDAITDPTQLFKQTWNSQE